MNITVYPSASELNLKVCATIIELANSCIRDNGHFSIALAGGSTPKQLYQTLATQGAMLDWSKIFIYFGDERYLPHSDPASNYRMVKESLLQQLPIPQQNVFPPDTSFDHPADAAQDYENTIRHNIKNLHNNIPSFDLILLGVGEDGHTASIFPASKTLTETYRLVSNAYQEQSKTNRITFTLPLINAAKNIFIIASGDHKKTILSEIQQLENKGIKKYPIQFVEAVNHLGWFMDSAAASKLSH